MAQGADGHRHLPVLATAEPQKARRMTAARWVVVGLAATAVVLYVVALTQPWWRFWLFAPQYPKGLELIISLKGVAGDVREIDTINHYIGMGHLETAATFERRMAAYGVGAIGVLVVGLTLLSGRKLGWLAATIGLLFPAVFVADSMYWLHRFGHDLDPKAPLHIKAFTPQMFGTGIIGQFETYAAPYTGFWLALAAFGLLAIGTFVRSRVCASCGLASNCGVVCPSAFVGPGAGGGAV